MNAMLIKELIQLKRLGFVTKIIFFLTAVLLISSFGIRTNILLWVLIFAFNTYAVSSMLRFDVPTYWNRWCVTTPIPRGDFVKSKYIISSMYEILAVIAAAVGMYIFISTHQTAPMKEICYAVSAVSFLVLIDTVTLVFIFWHGGYHGGQEAYIINLILVLAFIMIPVSFTSNISWIFLLLSLAARISSLPLSVCLYEQRSL